MASVPVMNEDHLKACSNLVVTVHLSSFSDAGGGRPDECTEIDLIHWNL